MSVRNPYPVSRHSEEACHVNHLTRAALQFQLQFLHSTLGRRCRIVCARR